ncbi:alpha/beta fold hydrolase [Candidatus Uhrbacteria bacterium]|nr:alpha/beta fold hydrolase [Candidatus Uhrbacteria bacterium]
MTTSDGVRIAGHWYPVTKQKGWALLLHMMPAAKESYGQLAEELERRDIASLAIDFRGHGESQGGQAGYVRFSDAEHQMKIHDVAAAVDWLREQGARDAATVLVGASIGANLALQYLADHGAIPAAVLLSPGLDYRGVKTEPLARRVASSQRVLLAAGGEDDDYSTETVRALAMIMGDRATTRKFANAGHGTTMFQREPTLLIDVADWIAVQVNR